MGVGELLRPVPRRPATTLLAPRLLAVIQRQRVTSRTVEDFGQTWPLPVADGV
jgi:hypothetical protein